MLSNSSSLYSIRHWPVWLVLGLLWLISRLPYVWQITIGKGLGLLAYKLAKREREIATINIERCFPTLSKAEKEHLLKESFISMGIGTVETAFGWWASSKRLKKLITVNGIEHLDNALAQGKGALVFSGHFSSLHICGRLVNLNHPHAAMFFPPKNPIFRWVSLRSMTRYYKRAIPRDDARALIRSLKDNLPVLYTPDTDAGLKNSIFVPFFNIMTATVTATARFAKITGAAIIPCFYYRRSDNKGYVFTFYPALENFPTEDPYADALRINQILEKGILEHPEQYLWQYKRFKTRPPGEEKFYPKR